ncbi:MAG: prolipoprotein diacylglyceryl transferase [Pseudomonadota bacterium]|nr:prolipoprotein diacylglyceryl transferase [Pseudomonadota bacterium]
MFTHNLDPVIFSLGFISIRWYSLAYVLGILIGWWYGKKLISNKSQLLKEKFNLKHFDDLITYLVISIIIGGRLGYVFFYNIDYYFNNPVDIFKIWEGGMSFHGALIGIILGTYIFSIQRKIETLFLLDVIACVSPIGIFFGRIANFINGELVGKESSVPWSVIFSSLDLVPRHPSQLYEAVLEGLILFVILNIIFLKKKYEIGKCSCLFLIYYGIFRIISEFFREPDIQLGYIFDLASMGSILSFVMLLSGLAMFYAIKKR